MMHPGYNGLMRSMIRSLLLFAVVLAGSEWGSAQAPKGWKQTAGPQELEKGGQKAQSLGQWESEDGELGLVAARLGEVNNLQDFKDMMAGLGTGVMKSGTLPLRYEALKDPHPGLMILGQRESEEGEYFERTYVFITDKGAIMMKSHSAQADREISVGKWKWGEPIGKNHEEFSAEARRGVDASNENIGRFQELVRKMREAQKGK